MPVLNSRSDLECIRGIFPACPNLPRLSSHVSLRHLAMYSWKTRLSIRYVLLTGISPNSQWGTDEGAPAMYSIQYYKFTNLNRSRSYIV